MSVRIAIIGGTGVYDPNILKDITEEKVDTPFGGIKVKVGSYQGKRVAFMAGTVKTIPWRRIVSITGPI